MRLRDVTGSKFVYWPDFDRYIVESGELVTIKGRSALVKYYRDDIKEVSIEDVYTTREEAEAELAYANGTRKRIDYKARCKELEIELRFLLDMFYDTGMCDGENGNRWAPQGEPMAADITRIKNLIGEK